MGAGTLQVSQETCQHTGLLREWDGATLTVPETPMHGVHTDFIHGLAHGVIPCIGEGEQLPLHPRPAQMQRDGTSVWAIRSEVQQPALALASRLQFGFGGDQSQPLT
ncbi:hypothetical protein OI71_00470 [Aeromonas hydrophila]|nr:hypothetical protein OI71_00470 [Aeromonas hydrophila]